MKMAISKWTQIILALSAIGSIAAAKLKNNSVTSKSNVLRNCLDLYDIGVVHDGIYTIWPYEDFPDVSIKVFCDMTTDGGGWTLIQRRDNYTEPEDFYRTWNEYARGFGDVSRDFWLGNDNIHALTQQKPTQILFDFHDWRTTRAFARYGHFSVAGREDNYRLEVSDYGGDFYNAFSDMNGMAFTTKDRDNDYWMANCADNVKGGWWYHLCQYCNPNGAYFSSAVIEPSGNFWWYFPNQANLFETLKKSEMKIRPKRN